MKASDFRILEEAFGYVPRKVASFPFVSSYGPLNFFLANRVGSRGGFDPAPLEEPPLLTGGRALYPPALVDGLPPPQLALSYPPHLKLVNEGYALGLKQLRADPVRAVGLIQRKLRIFASGATLGFTGSRWACLACAAPWTW